MNPLQAFSEAGKDVKISVVTVNLDGRAHLEALLPSLAAQDRPPDEVVVVDNGSTDDSVAWLRAQHPHVKLVCNTTNQGFARATNQGVAAATGSQVLLLNNDMHLAPDFVRQLAEARQRMAPDVACLAARILDWDGRHVDFVGAGATFDGKGLPLEHGRPVGAVDAREQELLFACGGAMLVDRAVYQAVGGLDEDFFAYYEDVDFGWRLWVLGYRVTSVPAAVAYHRHHGTSSRFGRHRLEVLFERNAMYALVKNHGDAALAAYWPAALLLAFKRLAVRSGLDRRDWTFARAAVPAPGPPEPAWPKLWRSLRKDGVGRTLDKLLYRLGESLVRRHGPDPAAHESVPMSVRAYATAVAMEDLIDHLPALMARRKQVQAARRRLDAEIWPLFVEPWTVVEGGGDYARAQATLLAALGLGEQATRGAASPT